MAEQVRNAPPPVPIVKATTRAEVDAELAKPMPRGSRAKIEKLDGLADKLGLANDEVVAEWAPTKPNAARNQLIDEWLLTVGGAISSYSKELAARTQRGLRRFAVEFRKLEDWTKHFDKDFDFSRELSDVHAPGKQSEYMDSHRMYTQLWERLRGAGIWRMRVKDLESRIKTARPDEAEAFRELEARATRRIQEMDAVVVEKPKSEQAQVVALAMGSRMFGVSLSDMRKVLTWQPSEKVMRGAKAYRRMVDIAFTEFAKRAIDSKIPFDTWKKGAYLPGAIPRWIMEIPTSSKLVPGSVERQQALQARMRDNMAIAASDLMDVPVPYAVNMLNQAKHFRADRQFYQVSINDAVAKKFGAIDFHRSLHTDVGIEIDFARMVRSYFRPGLLRINTAREFGPNTEIAADLIRKAGAEGKNVVELTRLFDVATGQTPRLLHGQQNRILAELSGLVGIKHLGSSWLPQFIATGHIWAESGFKDLVRALPGSFRASIAQSSIAPRAMRETEQNVHWRKFVNKSGSMSQQELVSVFSEMSAFSPKIAAMLLRYPYLTGPVDRWTRNLAAIAGTLNTERVLANYRHHLAQGNKVRARLERQRLQERFGEDPKILQAALDPRLPKANLEELAFLGGQIIGERAVGRNFAFDLPLAAADPFLGHVFKLSQYVIRQTARSLRAADPLNEASVVRNPATWLRYLSGIAAAMGMSYGVLHLRELIVNGDAEKLSKDPIWRRTKDVISYGGLYSQVYDGWDLATGRYGPVGEKILGPTFGLGLDFVSAAA
ncbi:MAG TPA: hypothetical protein VFB99_12665, partial [Vicinamibacterales bacterium]|nr:hypothetical protein [Vicinamibacterales bacterium]